MTERGDSKADEPEVGVGLRLVRALELLARAHASQAGDEAKRDLGRIVSGLLMLALAAAFGALAVLLLHVALVLVLAERLGLSAAVSCAVVGGLDVLVGLLLWLVARARVFTPVLVQTRATLRRAVHVLRG